jgi:DnaJ-class molecular chaperone
MKKKIFKPGKYGMVICPSCYSHGYIQNPKRQCCPKCGGFGFIKMEAGKDTNIPIRND